MKPDWQSRLICWSARMVRGLVTPLGCEYYIYCGICGGVLPMDDPGWLTRHKRECRREK